MGLYENKNGVLSPIAGRGNIDGVYKAQGILGAKNLIPYPYYRPDSYMSNGITFIVNADKSITANGTATDDANYACVYRGSNEPHLNVNVGEQYILSGSPAGSSISTYYINILNTQNGEANSIARDFGGSATFTLPTSEEYYGVGVVIKSGVTVTNLTFKPMLRLASDTDSTYQPYAMTNKELTERIKTIVSEAVTEAFSAHAAKWHDNANDCNVGFERTNNYRTSNMPTTGTEQKPSWYNIMTVRESNDPTSSAWGYGIQIAVQTTTNSTMGDTYVRAVNGGATPTWSEWKKLN